ncbi:hypothetical protein AWE51_22655 [Aquimarina aggregata]|uniref:Right handed beta helix domain-containing protein n=2 Tax=Aquimarina aggregata TaxID=1642818 RepID=A0A163BB47_9FLAO|nr:hypothetical protein AWE51_22655 [Aquimarina aggregata]
MVYVGCSEDEQVNSDIVAKTISIVNVLDHGALGDGVTNDTQVIQNLLDDTSIQTILFETNKVFVIDDLTIPSNKTLIIDGTLQVNSNMNYGYEYYNFIYGKNVNDVIITGNGFIDGNKRALNNGYFSLIKFEDSNNIEVSVKKIGNNRLPNPKHSSLTLGCIYMINCNDVKVQDMTMENWSREGVWLLNCKDSNINNVDFNGDVDSWSGIQVGDGSNNSVSFCNVKNAGASGISFDTKFSTLSNCIVEDNTFHHGFNFGHSGLPTENCRISDCISRNSAVNGFNFGFGSNNNNVSNCHVDNANDKGFNVSNNATNIDFDNISAKQSNVGLALFETSVRVTNSEFLNNTTFAFFNIGNSADYVFRNVRLSNDPMQGEINFTDPEIDFTNFRISNGNVRKLSKIRLESAQGNTAVAFLKEIGNGYFVVETALEPNSSAHLKYYIE